VVCPECQEVSDADNVNVFPKNLALLNMKKAPIKIQRSSRKSQEQLCKLHDKKVEAYCTQDRQLLCIDCILSETHKTHEIMSTQKASSAEKELLLEKALESENLASSLEK